MRASAAEVRPRMRRAMVVAPAAPGMVRVRGQVGARTGLDLRRSPPVARRACCAPRRTTADLWPRGAAAGASRARCGAPIWPCRDAPIRTALSPTIFCPGISTVAVRPATCSGPPAAPVCSRAVPGRVGGHCLSGDRNDHRGSLPRCLLWVSYGLEASADRCPPSPGAAGDRVGGGVAPPPPTPPDMRARIRRFVKPSD